MGGVGLATARTSNGKNKDEIQGFFAPLRMTTKNEQRQEQKQILRFAKDDN
jgi:hypothetical protein